MAKLIYLSPSNHGTGQNKCLRPDCYEDKHTRPIAEVCAKYLKNSGFDVIIGKTSQNMATRCQEANSKGASLYVPIHTNAAGASARYLLFMFYQDNAAYRAIYNAVAPFLEAIYPGGVKAHFSARPELTEIKTPKAKTLYCELGFHTNQTDVDSFIHDSESVGKALAQGICKYFDVAFSDGNAPEESPAKSIETIAKEVLAGKWGNGDDRKKRLTAAGYDYAAVQAKVNELMGVKAEVPKTYNRGQAFKLTNCPLYSSSTAANPAGKVTGTYYLWDGKELNGRYRITNAKNRVGVAGQVTGFVKKTDL